VTFTASVAVLILFAHAMVQAKLGSPLRLSWQDILAAVLVLIFFLVCGLPSSRRHRAVWLTFLTGTPAALGALMVWFALFRDGSGRNAWAGIVIGVGYIVYCVEVVLGSQAREAFEQMGGSSVLQHGGVGGQKTGAVALKPGIKAKNLTMQLHYFSALIMAAVLVVLFAALYAS
jgi:hypothetical protein